MRVEGTSGEVKILTSRDTIWGQNTLIAKTEKLPT